MKTIAILGSTGSIGRQVLDVVRLHPDRLRVAALSADRNWELLAEQALEFHPALVALRNASDAPKLEAALVGSGITVLTGIEGLTELATLPDVGSVVVSVAGVIGLVPTLAAIQAKKEIALASKEVLVAAGDLVMREARAHGVEILPIDSEHSAIFQCLHGEDRDSVARILLTASGGPFLRRSKDELRGVTPEMALAHPTWTMGRKITIDSATLMNKGLEIIEARWLFGTEASKIEVVVHPQSIIHSMVEFADGSVIAQLGMPDMRIPIQYALFYPERYKSPARKLNITEIGTLTFERPDSDRFPCLALAHRAAKAGGTLPAVMNAANEVAVDLFLRGEIGFTGIPALVGQVMDCHQNRDYTALDEILAADSWAREEALGETATVQA